ncbi:ABC transporter substrate-binding protein [Actinacidiphila acididurans]|uniref:ABC transporter substrate-binding protein n=1 Tax=Actinacidiphila acididurans TaxID=2784346 RepID=A0ABS2TP76_9ACTN|nr:ABC transporter substrate-binding protein [Actinacidiphila acididurans]MBM9504296.1 ABC transporter substrate-binding protein [Actinacidiphila acididurans]
MTSHVPTPSGTWDPPRRWWRGWRGITALVAALLLIGSGVYWLTRPAGDRCADGVAKEGTGRACVGLTDGSYPFTHDLDGVFARIHKENDRVAQQAAAPNGTPWVGVVYLMSMVAGGSGNTYSQDTIRHELEGAYVAQQLANRGSTVHIRLFLAHTGDDQAQRDFTLAQLAAHRDEDRIVAAVGLGTSTSATRATIQRLTGTLHIAAFGSVLTADDLAGIAGLVRVAPPNSDEAAAAAKYLLHDRKKPRVLVIEDTRADDLYTKTLADHFLSAYPKSLLAGPIMTYDSAKSAVATYFGQQMATLCLEHPDVIYYAGRGVDLASLLTPLSSRICDQTTVRVVSGDDISQVAQSPNADQVKKALRFGRIELVFTGLAHPGAWSVRPQAFQRSAIAPFQKGGEFLADFPGELLDDGQAIMGYDAMNTARAAITAAAAGGSRMTGDAVIQMQSLLYGAKAVPGASGTIFLDNSANPGAPRNKAIPIVEFAPDGSTSTLAVSSSAGTPPDA